MKRYFIFVLAILVLFNLIGCDALQRKFTRKKKATVKAPRIYQLKKYEKKPSPELYKQHYAYWQSWHSELIKVLGQNHKKDKRCIEEAVGHLIDMHNILVPEKGKELESHIAKLEEIKDIIFKEEPTQANKDYISRTLEREDRVIKKEFNYAKVKDNLKKSPEDEPAAGK